MRLNLLIALNWWNSLPWNVWLDYTDKIVKILAVAFGAVFAYVKFIAGRVYHTRLEPTVTGRTFQKEGNAYLVVVASLKNVGASKVDISQKGSALRIFSTEPLPPGSMSSRPVEWTRIRTTSVFEKHGWIEASETIEDVVLLALPSNQIALKLQLRIVARQTRWRKKRNAWTAETVVDIPNSTDTPANPESRSTATSDITFAPSRDTHLVRIVTGLLLAFNVGRLFWIFSRELQGEKHIKGGGRFEEENGIGQESISRDPNSI
jgi:hypothetical protein